MNGLARASVRFRPASFAGTFVALLVASIVVMACGSLLQTGLTARIEPVRYADAPIVVAADQFTRRVIGNRDNREEIKAVLPEGARIDASLASDIESTRGVAAAVPDYAAPVSADRIGPLTGRDWSTRILDGRSGDLEEGAAPGPGEVVLEDASAATAGISLGDTVTITAADGPHQLRLSGTMADAPSDGSEPGAPTAWVPDGYAAELAGHPGEAEAIAVFAEPGADLDQVSSDLRAAVGPDVEVLTGSDRGGVEAPSLPFARELLIGFGGSFGGVAALAAMFVVLSTITLAVNQRNREVALLRAIGATPRQVRRMVATEALLVAPLAGAAGIVPGLLLARWWYDQLVERGAVPAGVDFATGPLPALAAIGAGLLAALAGGFAAARRPARTAPSQALGEAAVEGRSLSRGRWIAGAAFIALGSALSILTFQLDGDSAAVAAVGVVMIFLVAVALLGPAIARTATAVLGLPLRGGGAASSLAAANSTANARRLASGITPIALVVASSSVLLFIGTTVAQATEDDVRNGVVADHVVTTDGPGLPTGAVAQAASVPGVDAAVGILRTEVLYNGFEEFETADTIAVSGDPGALDEVLDLGVTDGSLADVGRGTVALDHLLARSLDADLGDTVDLRLGDGTIHEPKVVAIYERGLGLGQVLLPRDLLADHVRTAYTQEIFVSRSAGASPDHVAAGLQALDLPRASVTDRQGFSARVDGDLEIDAWSNRVMAAVFGGFASIAAVNTLVMVVLDRRREVALLRLTGTTRRQVRAMFRWEAAIVAATGVSIGGVISVVTLTGFARAATDGLPSIPPFQGIGVLAVAIGLAFAAMALPSQALLRRQAHAGVE